MPRCAGLTHYAKKTPLQCSAIPQLQTMCDFALKVVQNSRKIVPSVPDDTGLPAARPQRSFFDVSI
jgi:hypothetical protein